MTVQNYVSLTSGTPTLLSPLRRAIQLPDVKVNIIANTYVTASSVLEAHVKKEHATLTRKERYKNVDSKNFVLGSLLVTN